MQGTGRGRTDEKWEGRNKRLGVEIDAGFVPKKSAGKTRTFVTGATRDTDEGKLDFEGFLSPFALQAYAEYMHKHRVQSDGSLRASDNWQKGIPVEQYVKSLWRHFFAVWKGWRQGKIEVEDVCALLFNGMGVLHELVTRKNLM